MPDGWKENGKDKSSICRWAFGGGETLQGAVKAELT